MELYFAVQGGVRKVVVEDSGETVRVILGDTVREVKPRRISENVISLDVGGKVESVFVAETRDKVYVSLRGRVFALGKAEGALEGPGETAEAEKVVRAPMPGQVVKIDVKEGDEVRKNQVLGAVEAMKMEHDIRSPRDGTVKKVFVDAGQLVDAEEALVEVE
jgi:3-methylcrotonyl-CoA carboxylase alpha subunit